MTRVSVCEYCFSGHACDHGTAGGSTSACACGLAGSKKCPGCGCECASWDWGLGFAGPATIRSFFGVGDDENPGFSQYPASKRQLVTAAQEELEEVESVASDVDWLNRNLPDGTYPDRGSALAALGAIVASPGDDPASFLTAPPVHALAVGTRLVVGSDQLAVLVARDGLPLDQYGPGEHVISRESAPRAAAKSRPTAPGFSRSVITATPFFASTREVRSALDHTGRTRSGESVQVRGSISYSIASLPEFLPRAGRRPRGLSRTEADTVVNAIFGPAIDSALSARDAGDAAGSASAIEASVRSAAGASGLRVSAVTIDSIAPSIASDPRAAILERQRQAMAHLPPETQARLQAQMAQAMERAQAARASRGAPAPSAPGPAMPAAVPAGPPPGLTCPACHAPNPPEGKFCGSCGQPLPRARTCAQCGRPASPGVKFCGNCGSPLT